MHLKKDTIYAVKLLCCYAGEQRKNKDAAGLRQALKVTGISPADQSRICSILAGSGYLEHKKDAGEDQTRFVMKAEPERITLRDVILATEGSTSLVYPHDMESQVFTTIVWEELQEDLNYILGKITISDMIDTNHLISYDIF